MEEKISGILAKIMLAIFATIIVLAIALGLFTAGHLSYKIAFVAACAVVFLYGIADRKLYKREFWCEREGALKTGIVLTAVCFGVSLAWVLLVRVEPEMDFKTFWSVASDIGDRSQIRAHMYIGLFPHILGYSAFLGQFIKLFGASSILAPVLNVLLSTFTGLLIYVLCLKWSNVKTAAFAYLLWTVCPSRIMYNTMVLSEPYYTFFIVLFAFLLLYFKEKMESDNVGWLLITFGGAVCAGVLAVINSARPVAAILIIAFFIWLVALRGKKIANLKLWKKWIVFSVSLIFIYVAAGQVWNNYAQARIGEEIPGIPGHTVYVGFNMDTYGQYSTEDAERLYDYRYKKGMTAVETQDQMLQDAIARIKSGEVDFAGLFSNKLRVFLGNDEGGAYYSRNFLSDLLYKFCAMVSNIWYYTIVILTLFGTMEIARRKHDSIIHIMPLYILGLTIAHMLVEVASRYHYSTIPFLIIIAAFSAGREKLTVKR